MLALIFWVFGDIILSSMPNLQYIGAIKLLNSLAIFILISGVFSLTYRAFGGKGRVELKTLPGALLSAAMWLIFSMLFEYYIEHFGRYSYVYGSLASMIVIMLWLYFCMEILLVGAGINMLLSRKLRLV